MCVNKEYRRICVADLMCGIWYVYAVCVKLPTEKAKLNFGRNCNLSIWKCSFSFLLDIKAKFSELVSGQGPLIVHEGETSAI